MKQRALKLLKYISKVYGFNQWLFQLKDGRINPHILFKDIFTVIFFGILVGMGSFNQMESQLKRGYFNKLLGKQVKGSADTFGYALARLSLEQLRKMNANIITRARRNKVFAGGTIDGFSVVAIDGTEVFRTTSERWSCKHCRRSVYNKGEADETIYYHENLVGAAYVGKPPNLIIGLEQIAPGEGETTAALRLIKSLNQCHYRYADILVFDALFAKAPVIKEVLSQNKIAVIRLKQENYHIIEDAESLFAARKPDLEEVLSLRSEYYEQDQSGKKYRYRVKIWDEENFTSWREVKHPLRVLKVEEMRISPTGKELNEASVTYIVTTAGKATLPTVSLWRIMHRRWDVENKIFHDLKTYWGFGHSFHHEENAFMAMRWIVVLAFNLYNLFYHRRISCNRGFTKKSLTLELLIGFYMLEKPLLEPG